MVGSLTPYYDFRDALHDGLGRAHTLAASVPSVERHEILLDACLHHRGLDPQLEGDRSAWLVEILDAVGDFDVLAPRIVAGVASLDEFWDVDQALHLLVHLARRGVDGARAALEFEFDRQRFSSDWIGALQVVDLDGLDGLVRVAQRIGRRLAEDAEFSTDDSVVEHANELFGAEAVEAALRSAAASDPDVARYAAAIEEERAACEATRRSDAKFWDAYDFEAVLEHLDDPEQDSQGTRFWMKRWGRDVASDRELEQVVSLLAIESRPARQRAWLSVFLKRAMPRYEPAVLGLLDSEDPDVAGAAHRAFGNLDHAEVRRLARARLATGRCDAPTIDLLARNFERSDGPLLLASLPVAADRERRHRLAYALKRMLDQRGTAREVELLQWGYRHAGCSDCRRSFVDAMLRLGCAPRVILEECRLDSSAEVRMYGVRLPTKLFEDGAGARGAGSVLE